MMMKIALKMMNFVLKMLNSAGSLLRICERGTGTMSFQWSNGRNNSRNNRQRVRVRVRVRVIPPAN